MVPSLFILLIKFALCCVNHISPFYHLPFHMDTNQERYRRFIYFHIHHLHPPFHLPEKKLQENSAESAWSLVILCRFAKVIQINLFQDKCTDRTAHTDGINHIPFIILFLFILAEQLFKEKRNAFLGMLFDLGQC